MKSVKFSAIAMFLLALFIAAPASAQTVKVHVTPIQQTTTSSPRTIVNVRPNPARYQPAVHHHHNHAPKRVAVKKYPAKKNYKPAKKAAPKKQSKPVVKHQSKPAPKKHSKPAPKKQSKPAPKKQSKPAPKHSPNRR